MLDDILDSLDSRRLESLEGLREFLRIPSVSTQPDHKQDVQRCAEWLAAQLDDCQLKTEIIPTAGHPVVLARNAHKPGRPTVLFYGHYDVQPPEPLELWKSPAFEPTIRKNDAGTNAIFARGAVDDKGQVWCHVEAIRAWEQHGGLPVNLTMLIEGEEEIGSTHLDSFVREHMAELKADVAVISDTGQFARGWPAITYGLRGIVGAEVEVTAADHDLHSGMYGGAVANPANALCELLGTLHDKDGRVTIPGFYDRVAELSPREREEFARLPFNEADFKRELKINDVFGESGYTTLERRWARPTLDINGLTSGYQGVGGKTIIPSVATAKITMRLVPDQDPAEILASFKQTLIDRCPKGVTVKVHLGGGGSAGVVVPIESPAMELAANAIERGFGKRPVFIREGGSIPVVALFRRELGLDTLLIGFGLPDDRAHSPNEKFDLDAFHAGTRTAAALYDELSRL